MQPKDTKAEGPLTAEEARVHRERIERLARMLDDAIPIPGTPWRIGADSLIGLVPVAGDVAGLALGSYLIYQGVRLRVPRNMIGRMVANAAIDALGGLVPVVGDMFDFAFKSHRRNAQLLIAHLSGIEGVAASPGSRWRRLAIAGLVAAAILAAGWWVGTSLT